MHNNVRTVIRPETPADFSAIREIHLVAFPTTAEADLVERLRSDADAVLSLVSVREEQIVGHVMFSRMRIPSESLGLAPVAVLASHRRMGIAEALIRDGLRRAKHAGWKAVFVLGSDYYQRFGFDPAMTRGLKSSYAGPHLMGVALQPEPWTPHDDRLEYAGAFAALG